MLDVPLGTDALTMAPARAVLSSRTTSAHPARGSWIVRLVQADSPCFNFAFDAGVDGYGRLTRRRCGSPVVLVVYGGLIGFAGYGFAPSPTGFVPEQDQGYLLVNVALPDAASVQRTMEVVKQLEEIALKTPGVKQTHEPFRLLRVLRLRFVELGDDLRHPRRFQDRTTPEDVGAWR